MIQCVKFAVSVSVSVGNGGATATIAAGTPTTCDNTDNTASVGSYDTVAGVAVSAVFDDSYTTASVSSEVAPSADATAAGTPIVSDDSDNTTSVSSEVVPLADATTAGTPIVSDDSDNTVSFGGDDVRTPILTDDSDNAIPAGGDTAIAATADALNLSIDSDNTPVRRDSAAVSITTDSPSVADAANTSVVGVSAVAVAITSDSSDPCADECCSETFICTLCSAGVRVLFDQFKVEQSNSLKSVVTGLNNDLRDVRQETLT